MNSKNEHPKNIVISPRQDSEGKSDPIPMEDMQDGWLYLIDSRDANCGIWVSDRKRFVIAVTSFGYRFLTEGDHFDSGQPFGNIKPMQCIELSPFDTSKMKLTPMKRYGKSYFVFPNNDKILSYLDAFTEHISMQKEKEND